MYTGTEILSYQTLNNFENRIVQAYNRHSEYVSETYTPKNWIINTQVFVNDIKHLEDGIEYLGFTFSYPNGWITSRNWDLEGKNNISYIDLNRWDNNLKILEQNYFDMLLPKNDLVPSDGEFNAIYPSSTDYPDDNKYNGEYTVLPLIPYVKRRD